MLGGISVSSCALSFLKPASSCLHIFPYHLFKTLQYLLDFLSLMIQIDFKGSCAV